MADDSFIKDPDAKLDYSWDWTLWLADANDSIESATVTVVGVTAVGAAVVADGVVTQVVEGGIVGEACSMVCQIATVGGRVDERTINLTIIDR
jgi:hypothetical protein